MPCGDGPEGLHAGVPLRGLQDALFRESRVRAGTASPETIADAPGPPAGPSAAGRSRTACAAREGGEGTKRPRRTTPRWASPRVPAENGGVRVEAGAARVAGLEHGRPPHKAAKGRALPYMARATIPPRAGRRHGRREGGRRPATPLRLPEAKRRAGRACPASPRGGAADLNRAIKTASRSAWRKVGKKARRSAAHPKQRGQPAPQAPQQGGRKGLCLPGTIEEKGSRLVAGFVMFYSFIRRCMGPGEGAGRGRRPRHRRAQPAGRAHAQRVRGSRDQAAVERGAKGLLFLLPGRAALQKAANPRPRQAQRASARRLDQIFSSCLAGGPAAAREADAFIA